MRVLICGAGVIGTSVAYFLSQRDVEVIVIERTGVACAASGKSGGFLALDWCDGSALGPLARRSFALHEQLAQTHGADWGYRRLDTLGVVSRARGAVDSYRRQTAPEWLGDAAAVRGRLGSTRTTAQVHPGAFTEAMLAAAVVRGAQLRTGAVTGVALSADGARAVGIEVDGAMVAGDAVVIALGPWSVLACQWLPLPGVQGLKGHSIVLRPARPLSPYALFIELEAADGSVHAPEVFPRADGTVYMCGLRGEAALPVDPAHVAVETGARETLRDMIHQFAPALDAVVVERKQIAQRVAQQHAFAHLALSRPAPDRGGERMARDHGDVGHPRRLVAREPIAVADDVAQHVPPPRRPGETRAEGGGEMVLHRGAGAFRDMQQEIDGFAHRAPPITGARGGQAAGLALLGEMGD